MDESSRSVPTKRATINMEEGRANTTSSSSGGNASSSQQDLGSSTGVTSSNGGQIAAQRTRTVEKDASGQGFGLAGHGAPPRRMTMRSDGAARSFHDLFTPEKRLKPAPNSWQSFKNIIFLSPLNILLLCIPISWALYFALDLGDNIPGEDCNAHIKNNVGVFVTAFLAIMPLAQLLSYGTEEIALRVGQTLGGLINATLGNAVELIVAIIALFHCELTIVQTSLIGSVLSNLLLVLGTCFFVGGLRFKEQEFKQTAAQLNSGLLAMAVIAVLIPAGFHATLGDNIMDPMERDDLLKVSRGTSIILLVIYGGYLFFTLSSHKVRRARDEYEASFPTTC